MIRKKKEKKPIPRKGLEKVLSILKPYGKTMLMIMSAAILHSAADVTYPLFNRYVIEHFIAGQTLDGLPLFIGAYMAVLALQIIINGQTAFYANRVQNGIDEDLRNVAFGHIQTMPVSFFDDNGVGYIHFRVMTDVSRIGSVIAFKTQNIVWNAAYIIFAITAMAVINVRLAVWMLPLVGISTAAVWAVNKKITMINMKLRETSAGVTKRFNERITGIKTIRLLCIERLMQKEYEKDTESIREDTLKISGYSALNISFITLMSSAALSIMLWKGGMLTEQGVMKIGTLSVFISYTIGIIDPVEVIIKSFISLIKMQVNIRRIAELLAEQPDIKDTQEVTLKYGDTFHPKYENWESMIGDIEFRDVSFCYKRGESVLEHFSLKIKSGEKTAIVGETGAGKTTIAGLLCRFYEPDEGAVLIDGKDIRARSIGWLHENVGYILQDTYFFSGTLRENMQYGNHNADDEEIMKALKTVSAGSIVKRIGGLDKNIGEKGSALSPGERQLLSLARVLLSDPKILVLDEATSSVDTASERAVQHAVSEAAKGRTSVVIAHRLSTVVDADNIIVLKDGKIVESGTHAELMKKKGYYSALYREQSGAVSGL